MHLNQVLKNSLHRVIIRFPPKYQIVIVIVIAWSVNDFDKLHFLLAKARLLLFRTFSLSIVNPVKLLTRNLGAEHNDYHFFFRLQLKAFCADATSVIHLEGHPFPKVS